MPKVNNTFLNGKMNSDLHNSLIDNKSYKRAENLRIAGIGKDGAMINLRGSIVVSNEYNEVGMKVVGSYAGSNNKNYFLRAMPNGKSQIIEYDVETQDTKIIIQDNSILRFDLVRWKNGEVIFPYKFILSIDQIGDLLFISNEKWRYPRVINVKRDYSTGFLEEDIILAKKPPTDAPLIVEKLDKGYENEDSDSFISFTYRYKYIDGDYSALSFYSDTAFYTKGSFAVDAKKANKAMVNKYDFIRLAVNSGGKNVTDVEVFAREHKSNTAYRIYAVNKEKSNIADNTVISDIEYTFSKNYMVLDEETTNMLFSRIPHFPKAQTSAGNRIVYGNYKEDFDVGDVDFEVINIQTEPTESDRRTAVSIFKYKVAVIYYNDYNESTTALLPVNENKSEIEIKFADRLKRNNIHVLMLTPPPDFATKMKFAVNFYNLNYEILKVGYAKKIGAKKYILINGDNVNRIKKGDTITVISGDANTPYNELYVENIKQMTLADGVSITGLYAEVGDPENVINIEPSATTTIKNYSEDWRIIDARVGSTDPARWVGISGYSGSQTYNAAPGPIKTVGYSSHHNRAYFYNSHFGQINEGDSVTLKIVFHYQTRGTWIDKTTDTDYGAVTIVENYTADSDYGSLGDLISSSLMTPALDIRKTGDLVELLTNYDYPEMVFNAIGSGSYGSSPFVKKAGGGSKPPMSGTPTDDKGLIAFNVKMSTDITIKKSNINVLLRTKNKENINEIYYETPKTYLINNGQFVPDKYINDIPAFDIGFYNGYCWGNGAESYKIKDFFNAKEFRYNFRPNGYDKKGYKQVHKKNYLTYSGFYQHELGINNLSTFNASIANWKELPNHYGEIQRIISTDGDISVFMNNKVIQQMYGKSIIMDLTGNDNVGISKEVLGDYRVLPYEFGISENPESIAKFSNMIFFTDKNRRRFLLKQGDTVQELNTNEVGFFNEGVELLENYKTLLGSYDEKNNEYVVSLDLKKQIGFNLGSKGFTSYYNYQNDMNIGAYGKHFTAYKGVIYENEVSEGSFALAGQYVECKLVYVVNPEIDADKIFKAHFLQSNVSWNTKITTNLTESFINENFYTQKESFQYTEIHRDTGRVSTGTGIGVIKSIDGNVIEFTQPVSKLVFVNDEMVGVNSVGIRTITAITDYKITVTDASGLSEGEFCYTVKQNSGNYNPDGAPIRGKWMQVELYKDSDEPIEITSVSTEIIKSAL